ncbi:MAG: TonB-dependent receptor [Prevotella sp.]|nr:TonB-dependent receptor [Prevotella sp.]
MIKRPLLMLAALAASITVSAQQDSVSLDEVVVTGTRTVTDVRYLPMTVNVISRGQLTQNNQMSILPTVMQQVPGLFVTSRSMYGYGVSTGAAGSINMRGISGGAGQLLVLIDGHPQYNGIYGHPISDSYQTLMAERVEVLRGPASVIYGSNAMGGVINIVTRKMLQDGVRTDVRVGGGSYGTVLAEASNTIRKGKFSSMVGGEYSRTDNHRPNMGFEQYGGHLKLAYDFTPNWDAYVDADITHFNASYPGAEEKPIYGANQWITRGVVSAAVENNYEKTNGALSIFTNFGRHKIDDGSADATKPTSRYFRSKDALTGISWYQSARLFEGNRLTLGADYQHIYGNAYYTDKTTGDILVTPNKQSGRSYRNEVAGYFDVRQDLVGWLTLDAGLRLDHHSITGSEWIPQFGVVVRPLSTGEVKAMVSKGFRNPTMREMFLYPPSNEELKPERMWNYELSWRHRLQKLSYGANLFYIDADNIILTTQVGSGKKNLNSGRIRNYGAELEATYHINDMWALNTNHSFLKMKKQQVVAAPKYKGFLGADFRLHRLAVNAGLQYISGLGLDSTGDGIADKQEKDFVLLNMSVNYHLNNIVTLWANGENLLAQRYQINYGYPMPRATFMAGVNVRL